jgi:type I site-specific restriction endonuclease
MPSERETRANLIDRQLQLANWTVDDPTQVVRDPILDYRTNLQGNMTSHE